MMNKLTQTCFEFRGTVTSTKLSKGTEVENEHQYACKLVDIVVVEGSTLKMYVMGKTAGEAAKAALKALKMYIATRQDGKSKKKLEKAKVA